EHPDGPDRDPGGCRRCGGLLGIGSLALRYRSGDRRRRWNDAVIEAALRHGDDRQALIAPDRGVRLSHGALAARVEQVAEQLLHRLGTRRLVMLAPGPDVEAVLVYLACLR